MRQAKNRTLEVDATEIRFRAERRLGELITAQKETVGLAQGKRTDLVVKDDHVDCPTLAEAGISHDLSSRAQKLAAVPEDEFQERVDDWREEALDEEKRVSTKLWRSER